MDFSSCKINRSIQGINFMCGLPILDILHLILCVLVILRSSVNLCVRNFCNYSNGSTRDRVTCKKTKCGKNSNIATRKAQW